jgi:hypothetical protein
MTVSATQWVRRGTMVVNRDCLAPIDKESWVSLWFAEYGTLDGFPWEDVYGATPSSEDLARWGFATCPVCGQQVSLPTKRL